MLITRTVENERKMKLDNLFTRSDNLNTDHRDKPIDEIRYELSIYPKKSDLLKKIAGELHEGAGINIMKRTYCDKDGYVRGDILEVPRQRFKLQPRIGLAYILLFDKLRVYTNSPQIKEFVEENRTSLEESVAKITLPAGLAPVRLEILPGMDGLLTSPEKVERYLKAHHS